MRGFVPLWRAVDFADAALTDDDRTGVEAALLASGLLTAHLTPAGAMTAADGQVLLTTAGPVAARPLRGVLTVDASCLLDSAVVAAVLDRVAVDDPTHPVWIARDGRWGNGPLTGRHRVRAAAHIGAAARAAARVARLAEIAGELAALDGAGDVREQARRRLTDREDALALTGGPSDVVSR